MHKHGNYKDLLVWQKSVDLVDEVYGFTAQFPDFEKFGLANQLRRAAVSIPSNLAEGSVRGKKDFARFIRMARGSLAEVETQCLIASRRKFISQQQYEMLETQTVQISKMLMGLLRSIDPTPENN